MEHNIDESKKDCSKGVDRCENKISMSSAPHKREWILGAMVILMAYFYLSVIRYPTELARVIWWKAQLNTEYFRVGLAWMVFTAMFIGTGLWYVMRTAGDVAGKSMGNSTGEVAGEAAIGRSGRKGTDLLKCLPKESWIYFGLALAAGLWFLLYMNDYQDMFFYMILFLHGVAVYWLMTVTGSVRGKELDERGIGDLFRGFFVLPFSGYPQFFVVGGQLISSLCKRKDGKHSKVWQVVLGLLISVPVLCIAIPMLRGADVYFDLMVGNLLQKLFHALEEWGDLSALFTAVWTLVLAGYFFGLFYRGIHKKSQMAPMADGSVITVEEAVRRQFPQVVLTGFLIPIVLLYLLFFVVRILGVAGAMDQIASGELWISTYAREGFFELCWIAAINFVIFTVSRWYSPRAGKGIRCLISGLGVETMAFVGFAFSKMWYYIQAYGSFTFKRAMCCWLLLTLLVTFGLMTLELWKKNVKGIKWGVWFGSVTFLMMAYSNMPAWAP